MPTTQSTPAGAIAVGRASRSTLVANPLAPVDVDEHFPHLRMSHSSLTRPGIDRRELIKHAEWCEDRPELYHYRDGRDEIDIVIEDRGGDLACVEVKATASLTTKDYRVMARLRDARSTHFKAGVVLYAGAQTIPLGDRLWAVPISGLWTPSG